MCEVDQNASRLEELDENWGGKRVEIVDGIVFDSHDVGVRVVIAIVRTLCVLIRPY